MAGERIAAIGVVLIALSIGYPSLALAFGTPDIVLLFLSAGLFGIAGVSLLAQGIRRWRRGGTEAASAFREELDSELLEE